MQHEDSESPLHSTYANDEAIAEILPIFVNNMPKYLGDLEARIQQSDWVAAARVCHDLKGTAGGYGYPEIGRLAQVLEAEIKGDRNPAMAQKYLQDMRTLYLRARRGLENTQMSDQ